MQNRFWNLEVNACKHNLYPNPWLKTEAFIVEQQEFRIWLKKDFSERRAKEEGRGTRTDGRRGM